jgi:hypothetical protein
MRDGEHANVRGQGTPDAATDCIGYEAIPSLPASASLALVETRFDQEIR